ncbi:Flp family type IVb pilin [Actinocorallia longicatena]|uniref:Pilus assembly protein Flp/PilA n=1 Tax=Actinocorallia longicatena TaxID=111803 RepID=A0ABP6QIA3_9ACTN
MNSTLARRFVTRLRRLAAETRDAGASAVEYALLVGLIAIVIIVGATALGTQINQKLNNAASSVQGAGGGATN